MKKILSVVIAAFLALQFASAAPADPRPYKYTQPDGTVIVLQNHGDEFFHWTTNEAGETVEKGQDGFYRPVSGFNLAARSKAAQQAREACKSRWSSYEHPFPNNFGDKKILCIIANFTDSTFVLPNIRQHFSDMLNTEGYNENGAVGSLRDYFKANSGNQFRPSFDVFGPVTLSHSSAYYANDGYGGRRVEEAILEAYQQLKTQITIADYDNDNDGNVDMVLFYYPGHNPAEGGGPESIWPYQGTTTGSFGDMGGKSLVRFFCTSELRGSSGTEAAGIGTTCHEFCHALGLPDFYDADYASNGYNEITTGYFDLMSRGNYNSKGRRPPYLSAIERNMLGWMDYPAVLSSDGDYSLNPIQGNNAYRLSTGITGEYFVMETRSGEGWDQGLPTGLLFYHVDQSDRIVNGTQTAFQLWDDSNAINVYGGHPCYYLVPPVLATSSSESLIFPGPENVQSYVPVDWNGNTCGVAVTGITFSEGKSNFHATFSNSRVLTGYVKDTSGEPVSGANVSLVPSVSAFGASAPAMPVSVASTTTDENGYYSLVFPSTSSEYQVLSVSKEGYVTSYANITFSSPILAMNVTLVGYGKLTDAELQKYDSSQSTIIYGFGRSHCGVAMQYTAEELASMNAVGARLKTVSFRSAADLSKCTYGKVNIFVAYGNEFVKRVDVTSGYTPDTMLTFDVYDQNIIIPENKEIRIGYEITGLPEDMYPFYAHLRYPDASGSYHFMYFDEYCYWDTLEDPVNDGFYLGFEVSATIERTKAVELSDFGVSYIVLGEGNIPTVKVAAGKSLKSITWTVDGVDEDVVPATNTLSSGDHTYMARLTYYDGTSERVYYDIKKL